VPSNVTQLPRGPRRDKVFAQNTSVLVISFEDEREQHARPPLDRELESLGNIVVLRTVLGFYNVIFSPRGPKDVVEELAQRWIVAQNRLHKLLVKVEPLTRKLIMRITLATLVWPGVLCGAAPSSDIARVPVAGRGA
jgi:hypothetical protein